MIGIAADLGRPALHVGIEGARVGDRAASGEHHFGGFGRKLAAGIGRTGLHDDGPTLHRAGDVQRPAHFQILALVIEHMHLVGIEIDAVLDIADEGIVGPAVPQAGDDIEKFACAGITLVMLHMLVEPEIERGVWIRGRHHVPARAPCADMVERGEAAGDRVGRLEGARGGGDQAEMLRRHRQRGQQGQRIERRHRGAALQRVHRHVQHGQVIGHEEGVELAALQGLGVLHQGLEVEVGVRRAAGIAPRGGVDADGAHEGAEAKLLLGHGWYVAPAQRTGKARSGDKN